MKSHSDHASPDLLKDTVRTVVVLVGACVLFVGTLSASAVAITSRAFGSRAEADAPSVHAADASAKPTTSPKKPLSI